MPLIVSNELDEEIVRLLDSHPELEITFQDDDLSKLDNRTKEVLLQDIRYVLGVSD